MGSLKKPIEALLVKYICLEGVDRGSYIEVDVPSKVELAAKLDVSYAAMTKRIHQSDLIREVEGRLILDK